MKILITGGSGLLGQYLNQTLSRQNEILTLYNSCEGNCKNFRSFKIDISDSPALRKVFEMFVPDTVIHTAAISRPETCDELPEDFVWKINVTAGRELAELCDTYKAKLIYTSTDLVYDGDEGQMLPEDSKLNPVSLYAKTKLKCEKEIENIFDNYITLRTALLYGMGLNHSRNNFHLTLENFRNRKPVRLFFDQFRTPLSLKNAADMIAQLISLNIKNIALNFGGLQRISRVEMGELICDMGKFDKTLIEKISMVDAPGLHKVADVSMNTSKLQSLGLKQRSIEEEVYAIINETEINS